MRATGSSRRRAIGFLAMTAALVVLFIPFGGLPAGAQTISHTFPMVDCLANVNGTIIHQSQDITVTITGPDSVTPGETFTVTFPGGSALLPSSSNGLTITNYSNLSTTFQINGTNFNSGTIVNPGTGTLAPTAGGATQTIVVDATLPAANQIKIAEPGPFPPGTLTLPDISVQATAPASGSITLNAAQLTTTVKLNGVITAAVTCAIPTDTIMTIPVTSGTTSSSSSSSTSSTTASTTTSTTIPTTTTSSSTTTSSTTTSSTTTSSTTTSSTTTSSTTTSTTIPTTTTSSSTTTTHPTTTTTSSTTTSTTIPTTTTSSSTTTTHPTTTTGPTTTTTVPVTSTTLSTCKPGWGFGDKNHCHSGPPGLSGDPHGHGPQHARSLAARLIDSRPTGASGVLTMLVLTALGLLLTVTVGPRWRRRRS